MNNVFVSYSSADRSVIKTLVEALSRLGWSIWWDRKILPGQKFHQEITNQLSASKCCIVVWSARSVHADFVLNEVSEAKARNIPIIPVRLDTSTIPLEFKHLHTVSLVDWQRGLAHDGFDAIVSALKEYAGEPIIEEVAPITATSTRALLVGVSCSSCWPELPKLSTPLKNVEAFDRILTDSTLSCFPQVDILRNPDQKELSRSLERLFKASGSEELILLYFSGPATLSLEEGIQLCACDTEENYIDSTSISLAFLNRRIVDKSRSERIIIILDCHFSEVNAASASGNIQKIIEEEMGKGRGKYIINTNPSTSQSIENGDANYSFFIRSLLEGLDTGDVDLNHDGVITAEEVFRYTRDHMKSKGAQPPEAYTFDIKTNDLVILKRPDVKGYGESLECPEPDLMKVVLPLFSRKVVIPFLGSGMYGSGPLSSYALSIALLDRAGLRAEENYAVATAAEYLERQYDDREQFLSSFREILEEQMSLVESTSVHDLILRMDPPLLVVSTLYDDILERQLRDLSRSYVVVSHVLHSRQGQHNGQILILRYDPSTNLESIEICMADELDLDDDESIIIYKVVGSPSIHDSLDPTLEIDTVVATEYDHATFIFRLPDQQTSIPTAFSLPFRQRFLFFMGYTLDTWHYRLVAHLVGKNGKRRRYTVRQPTSPIEHLSWRRLGAELIRFDPEAFAKLVIDSEGEM